VRPAEEQVAHAAADEVDLLVAADGDFDQRVSDGAVGFSQPIVKLRQQSLPHESGAFLPEVVPKAPNYSM
jgi:hypothetical protein